MGILYHDCPNKILYYLVYANRFQNLFENGYDVSKSNWTELQILELQEVVRKKSAELLKAKSELSRIDSQLHHDRKELARQKAQW